MGYNGINTEEYASMIEMVMEAYGVDEAEAEDELLSGYGIAKPAEPPVREGVTPTERDNLESMLGIEDGWSAL